MEALLNKYKIEKTKNEVNIWMEGANLDECYDLCYKLEKYGLRFTAWLSDPKGFYLIMTKF